MSDTQNWYTSLPFPIEGTSEILYVPIYEMSRDSSVRIALGYELDDRGSRVRFPAEALMMMTEMDIETSVYNVHLTRLIAREDFIKFTRRESTKTYFVSVSFRGRNLQVTMCYRNRKRSF
jgi:hypothetical protein